MVDAHHFLNDWDAASPLRTLGVALDEGDEVVLLEKHGTYWRVLCPNGSQGWLHKMTLGELAIDPAPDTWTAADVGPSTGTFEDVLRSYREQKGQFGPA